MYFNFCCDIHLGLINYLQLLLLLLLSLDLSSSTSMTPLLPIELSKTSKIRKRKLTKESGDHRADYFDATSEPEIANSMEPLIDLVPTVTDSSSQSSEQWDQQQQEVESQLSQVS